MIGFSRIYVYLEYNRKWENLYGYLEWIGGDLTMGFMVDRRIKFLNFVETIYKRTGIKQSKYTIKLHIRLWVTDIRVLGQALFVII